MSNMKFVAEVRKALSRKVEIDLFVSSGGRCQFEGCNAYVVKNFLTQRRLRYGEAAHIISFSEQGPDRGVVERPEDIDSFDNLMLLCKRCHKEVDTYPEIYTVSKLISFKMKHEQRIRHLTSMGPNSQIPVLRLVVGIDRRLPEITTTQIDKALFDANLFRAPDSAGSITINLNDLDGTKPENSFTAISDAIDKKVEQVPQFYSDNFQHPARLAIFALAPIAVLIYLGSRLNNTIGALFFQRHRTISGELDSEWRWKNEILTADYSVLQKRIGSSKSETVVVLSLSGHIDPANYEHLINSDMDVHEIRLSSADPNRDFLQSNADLEKFRNTYQALISSLQLRMPLLKKIHLFAAIPAPIAVLIGREMLPKKDATIVFYDLNQTDLNYETIFEISPRKT